MDSRLSHLVLAGLLLSSGVVVGVNQQPVDEKVSALTYRVQRLERELGRLQTLAAQHDETYATALRHTCVSNLKQIESAKEQWALVGKKKALDAPTPADLVGTPTTGFLKMFPQCPMGGQYTINDMTTRPTCSLGELGHRLP
ncbi:MAG TPA: hypothetical protein VK934_02510 [Fimbriimonas sp.]|nr:hypothetical protein [Fimbriimonas sp.]